MKRRYGGSMWRVLPCLLGVALVGGGGYAVEAAAAEVCFMSIRETNLTNIARNPGLDGSTTGWSGWQYETGVEYDTAEGHKAPGSIRFHNDKATDRHAATQSFSLNQKRPTPVLVSLWSKAQDVAGGAGDKYSLYIDYHHTDGTPVWGQLATFSGGTHDWQERSVSIFPTKPIGRMSVFALLRGCTGTAWFDDLAVCPLVGAGSFDAAPVVRPEPPPSFEAAAGAKLATDDMQVTLTTDGVVAMLAVAAGGKAKSKRFADITDRVKIPFSGLVVRDVAKKGHWYRVGGKVRRRGKKRAIQKAKLPEVGLEVEATYTAKNTHIEVEGVVRDLTGEDRAVSVYFVLPVATRGARWGNYIRSESDIADDLNYMIASPVQVGSNGLLSKYPFSSVSLREGGVSLAVAMDTPRLFRLGVTSGMYYAVCDMAIVRDTEKFPSRAGFKFIIYSHDPAWGFRSAAEKYYRICSKAFEKHIPAEGIWLITAGLQKIPHPEDFQFRYWEAGGRKPAIAGELDVLYFPYIEPWRWRRHLGFKPGSRGAAEGRKIVTDKDTTAEGMLRILEKDETSKNDKYRRFAWAVKSCGCHDENGNYFYYLEDAPWGVCAIFVVSPDPELPRSGPDNTNLADLFYPPAKTMANRDGMYIDSVEGFAWSMTRNFKREHFRYADFPLVFDKASRKPCILKIFSDHEFLRFVAGNEHAQGKFMMGNALPIRFCFHAALFDLMGTEINWFRGGKWTPDGDEKMCYRRTMCYHKPYLPLMNTDFSKITKQDIDKYFRRSMFYGMPPSMFSADAFYDRYFDSPKYYERDRDLFKKYLPVILGMSAAGWEPVTRALSSNKDVYIERFGSKPRGGIFFSMMNPTETVQQANVIIDLASLGVKGGRTAAEEMFGHPVRFDIRNDAVAFAAEIEPNDTWVVRIVGR